MDEKKELMKAHGVDEDVAETAQWLVGEGLEDNEAIEIADEL